MPGSGGEIIMWKLKSCPRCGGDFFLERDWCGWYEQCLQCGYRAELEDIAEIKRRLARKRKKELTLQRQINR